MSNHQGEIDWAKVAADDIDFAYIKASEGGDFVDRSFERNWEGAAANDLDDPRQISPGDWLILPPMEHPDGALRAF